MDEITLLFYIGFVAGAAAYAHHRGRNPLLWGAVALFISPLLAFIILACLKDQQIIQRLDTLDQNTQNLRHEVTYHKEFNDYRAQHMQQQLQETRQEQKQFQQASRFQSRALPVGMETQTCSNCQFKFSSEHKLCPNCGQIVEHAALQQIRFQYALVCPVKTHISHIQNLLMQSDSKNIIKEIEYLDVQTGGSLGGLNKKLIFVIRCWLVTGHDPQLLENQIRNALQHVTEQAGYECIQV